MTEERFKLKRGQRVNLYISGDDSRGTEQPTTSQNKFTGVELDEDNYVFRPQGELALFDLGTRLRTVPNGFAYTGLEMRDYGATDTPQVGDDLQNEYVEIRYEVAGTSIIGIESGDAIPTIGVSDEEFLKLRRMLLGSRAPAIDGEPDDPLDPLGFSTANGSSRRIPNCMPIYFGTYTDGLELGTFAFHIFPEEINDETLLNLYDEEKAFTREPALADANERWCPDNADSGAAFAQTKFTKEYAKSLVGGHIAIDDVGSVGTNQFYFPLDTQDTENVKITREPVFESDEVEYKYKAGDSFYLRPKLGGLKRNAIVAGIPRVVASWVSRRYANTGTLIPVIHNVQPLPARNWVRRSLYSQYPAEATATHANHSYHAISDPTLVDELLDGDLVAIISRKQKPFYLWRRRL